LPGAITFSCKPLKQRIIFIMTQDITTIRADQLTEGDIIQHRPSDNWMIISEPEYTTRGISFDVLCLDVEAADNTQTVCFAPETSFVLLDHQRAVQDDGLYCFGVIAVGEEEALAS
jgi:hypothetical protein